jgi:hypothetical protein
MVTHTMNSAKLNSRLALIIAMSFLNSSLRWREPRDAMGCPASKLAVAHRARYLGPRRIENPNPTRHEPNLKYWRGIIPK